VATLSYYEPFLASGGDYTSFPQVAYIPLQNSAWRRGSFMTYTTTGTIVTPPGTGGGTGALLGVAGPAASAVTIGSATVANAPGGTYYIVVTYAATGAESGPSQEFIANVLPGNMPTVNVAAAGAPSGATSYNYYVGLYPATEVKQNGAIVTLGTATTTPNPLTNNAGINQAATNVATVYGLAVNSSLATFYSGPGGSFQVNEHALFGATNSAPPLTPAETYLGYVVKLFPYLPVEISLNVASGAWSPMLIGTQVGLTLDATTGFFTADSTQSNKVATIVANADGDFRTLGQVGDYGKRVLINFLASAVA